MIYVAEGQLLFCGQESDAEVVLAPHRFVLLRPGGVFRLWCPNGGYRGFSVSVKGEVPRALRGEAVTGLADGAVRMLGGMIQRHVAAPVAESGEVLAAGFNNLSHFNHTFRAIHGCAPREFSRWKLEQG
ncbi:MAG: hypothetical protein HQ582_14640 [Planctomycetes bacterium]|nr:hypothetical protein [Planctomycetota bacterium]